MGRGIREQKGGGTKGEGVKKPGGEQGGGWIKGKRWEEGRGKEVGDQRVGRGIREQWGDGTKGEEVRSKKRDRVTKPQGHSCI